MSGLRILYVLPYVPSPIRVRPYQLIRSLARAGHSVTVVALADEFSTEESLAELRGMTRALHILPHPKWRGALQALLSLPTPTPLWAAYCHSGSMAQLLRELAGSGQFDVAHVEHLRAAHFADALGDLPRILDAVDCITALRQQMLEQSKGILSRALSWEEWTKLRQYEPRSYRPYKKVAVTSQYDADELAKLDKNLLAHVIPNGVDTEYFRPLPEVVPDSQTLVLSGKMSYQANEDAAHFLLEKIIVKLRQNLPNIKIWIVGSNPSDNLRRLAEATEGVTVTGFVDDIRPYLARATVAVCPMRIGVGIQNKALEAMAMGRPVIASPIAGRAIREAVATGGLTIADGAEAFASACLEKLTADPQDNQKAGEAARTYVEEHHRWEVATERFVGLYGEALAERVVPP